MSLRRSFTGFAAALTLGLALACGGSTPLTPAQADWAGKWVAADGTYVQVFMDGGGNYKGSNSNIDGGSATIGADSLTIGLGPVGSTFHVDAPPTDNGGVWTVTLDGVTYTRE